MSVAVSTTAELLQALSTAKPGYIIDVEPGNYGDVKIEGLALGGAIVQGLKSPSGSPKLRSLVLKGVSGLALSGLLIDRGLTDSDGDWTKVVHVTGCENIEIADCLIRGSLDLRGKGYGLNVDTSTDTQVLVNEFQNLRKGALYWGGGGHGFYSNTLHDIFEDGLDFNGVTGLVAEGNVMFDFHPAAGAHHDFFQSWSGASGVTIRRNDLRVRGGTQVVQGMLLGTEGAYSDILIEENVLHTGSWHGITIELPGENVVIRNNSVAGVPVADPKQAPQIGVSGPAVIKHNVAPRFTVAPDTTNHILMDPAAFAGDLSDPATVTVDHFRPRIGGPLDTVPVIGALRTDGHWASEVVAEPEPAPEPEPAAEPAPETVTHRFGFELEIDAPADFDPSTVRARLVPKP